MTHKLPIFLLTGIPGSGKTSVATALMQHYQLGLHIPVDDLREWVVSGIAHPIPVWTAETSRQFSLARQTAVRMARLYVDAGFAVVIDDVMFSEEAQAHYLAPLVEYPVVKVLLQPTLEAALGRNMQRTNKDFDTSILVDTIRNLHHAIAEQNFGASGWLVVNNTELSLAQTVDCILKHTGVLFDEQTPFW
jgi:predicted kinase